MNLTFSLTENVSKFVILGGNVGQIRSFYKFCRVGLNIWRMKIEFEIVGTWKFWYAQKCCSTNDSNVRLLGVRHRGLRCRYGNRRVQWLQRCPKRTEMPMVCWLRCEKEQDFPAKMDRSLSTYLSSQLVDCVGWASCIQGPKSRMNQVEWHRSSDLYNYWWKKLLACWQFWR